MEIILKGIVSGIVLALLVGPVFFTIIQTSIERGFRYGAFVATGVSLSDTVWITIAYLGLTQVTDNEAFKLYISYAGGIMLIVFGAYYLFLKNRKKITQDPALIKARSPMRYLVKGFIINGLTPSVLLFWLGTVSVATTKLGYDKPREAILFFSGIVGTVFITDLIKAKLADQLRHLITPKFTYWLNIVMGIALIAFGIRLLFLAV